MSTSPITLSPSSSHPPAAEAVTQVASQPKPAPATTKPAATKPAASAPVATKPAASAPAASAPTQLPEDTVQISQFAQIQQLSLQGESASEIAAITGLPLSEINTDIGVTTTAAPSIPVAAASSPSEPAPARPTPTVAAPAATSEASTATSASKLSLVA